MSLLAALPFPDIDPVAFRLGPVAVRWYGIAYLLGFVSAYFALRAMIRRGDLRMSKVQLGDLMAWVVAGVLAGGRLGWWLFYRRSSGAADPWYEVLAIWNGGMSFHGGLAGVAAVLAIWCRRRRADLWNLADCAALVAPIGLFFGRIANFINAELVGRPTAVPWGVIFPGEQFARHPSQLYEAFLEGPLLLLVLWAARRVLRRQDGHLAALFMVAYGIIRFGIEFTREPDDQLGFIAFGWLPMGQLLSVAIALVGTFVWRARGEKLRQLPGTEVRA